MRKLLSLLPLLFITACATTSGNEDENARYENTCIKVMGICPSDNKRMKDCMEHLRKAEYENSKTEYITEYKTEYKCCNVPENETRIERRVEYNNKNMAYSQAQSYDATTTSSYNVSRYKSAYSSANSVAKPDACQKMVLNGMNVERCTCAGKEPTICYEKFVSGKRARHCEAETLFNRR